MNTTTRFYMWLAWHLPKKLVMWATVRLAANATAGQYSNTETGSLTVLDALKRWDDNAPILRK